MYSDLPECKVQDLFSKHPNKDKVWLYWGQTEDLIVLVSGRDLPTEEHGRRDRVTSIRRCSANNPSEQSWPSVACGAQASTDVRGAEEAEVTGRHLAERAKRERDMSSRAKYLDRIGGDNRTDAEGGERVPEAEDGVRIVLEGH